VESEGSKVVDVGRRKGRREGRRKERKEEGKNSGGKEEW